MPRHLVALALEELARVQVRGEGGREVRVLAVAEAGALTLGLP